MLIKRQEDVTDVVVDAFKNAADPRVREILTAMVKHLHAFARDVHLTEEEFESFCASIRQPGGQIHERPGLRHRGHWLPALLRTEEIREVGGYSYIGSGYDIMFDNLLGDRGFTKIVFCDGFVLHKGFPPMGGVP